MPEQEDTQSIVRLVVAPLLSSAMDNTRETEASNQQQQPGKGGGKTAVPGGSNALSARERRLWDLVPRDSTGLPEFYIVHTWGARLSDVVEQLEECLVPKVGSGLLTTLSIFNRKYLSIQAEEIQDRYSKMRCLKVFDLLSQGLDGNALKHKLQDTFVWMDIFALSQVIYSSLQP